MSALCQKHDTVPLSPGKVFNDTRDMTYYKRGNLLSVRLITTPTQANAKNI